MDNFFGSKLNTVLLVVLIILMVIAIKIMLKDKGKYFPPLEQDQTGQDAPKEMDRTKILGNKDDLVSFSIWPGSKVYGLMSYRGVIKGAYFFEANILINVLDVNKNALLKSNAMATTDWMTVEPVSFEGKIDFTNLPKGEAYIEIHNDNPSDMRQYDKSILIPIVIESQ